MKRTERASRERHAQATRLLGKDPIHGRGSSAYGPDTLCGLIAPFMETWTINTGQTRTILPNTTFLCTRQQARGSVLGSSLFARRYLGNPS